MRSHWSKNGSVHAEIVCPHPAWAFLIAQLVKDPPAMQETWFDSWVRKIHWRRDRLPTPVFLGFPCGSAVKHLPVMWETWVWSLVGKIPWRGERLPVPVLVGYSSSIFQCSYPIFIQHSLRPKEQVLLYHSEARKSTDRLVGTAEQRVDTATSRGLTPEPSPAEGLRSSGRKCPGKEHLLPPSNRGCCRVEVVLWSEHRWVRATPGPSIWIKPKGQL